MKRYKDFGLEFEIDMDPEEYEITPERIEKWLQVTPKIPTSAVTILMPFGVPELPALIVDRHIMHACFTLQELGEKVQVCGSYEWPDLVTVIDNNGKEFFYELNRGYLRPDWWEKRWRKAVILDLYNNLNNKSNKVYVPSKKIRYLTVRALIRELCRLMVMN